MTTEIRDGNLYEFYENQRYVARREDYCAILDVNTFKVLRDERKPPLFFSELLML